MKLAPFDVVQIPDADKETAVNMLERILADKGLLQDPITSTALLE
jgi:hypothetical protein